MLGVALLLCGCSGKIGEINESGGGTNRGPGSIGGPGGAVGPGALGCDSFDPGPSPLRRLTRWEYNHTVHDLLGDDTAPATRFPPEAVQFGFDNNADGATLNPLVVEQYEDASMHLAEAAVTNLPALLKCDPVAKGEDACAQSFLTGFGLKAFRRPLEADELSKYQEFFRASRTTYGFAPAIEMVVRAILQAPMFLYRVEFGSPAPDATGAVPLTQYEIASRLSYLFWGSMPDDTLLTAASSGKLGSSEQISAQADRLLLDDKGSRAIQNFYDQWARAASLPTIDRGPKLTPEIAALLRTETTTFFDQIIRHGDSKWSTALTATFSYRNAELSTFYGVPGPTGTTFEKVDLDASRQTGFMTQAGVMTLNAHLAVPSPVLRGKFVREQLLCAPLPPPPNNVDTSLPAVDPNATARQQLEQKTQTVQPCKGCHGIMNPLGFAFEHFDDLGKWRDTDHGLPIDTTGELVNTDVDGAFKNQGDLMTKLASSEQVRQCVVTEWFRYAYGRDETAEDKCSTTQLQTLFTQSGGDIRKLLVGLAQTPAFTYRRTIAGGGP